MWNTVFITPVTPKKITGQWNLLTVSEQNYIYSWMCINAHTNQANNSSRNIGGFSVNNMKTPYDSLLGYDTDLITEKPYSLSTCYFSDLTIDEQEQWKQLNVKAPSVVVSGGSQDAVKKVNNQVDNSSNSDISYSQNAIADIAESGIKKVISNTNNPTDTERNKPKSFFEQYQIYIFGVVIILIFVVVNK